MRRTSHRSGILLCIVIAGAFLYGEIRNQNKLTAMRLVIPALTKEVNAIHEENIRLQYEIDRWENPLHLMQLARMPQFAHLKHPLSDEVIILRQADEEGNK